MPPLSCANCHKETDKKEPKRCGQCGIVLYCSKKCQTEAWYATHKRTCQSHVKNEKVMGPDLVRDQGREKSLSNWLTIWSGLFEEFTMRALDLANHKGEQRNKTHCYVIFIEETHHPNRARAFRIHGTMVTPCSKVIECYPGIESVLVDPPNSPGGLDLARWVMVSSDPNSREQGKTSCRSRVSQVVRINRFYELNPRDSKKMAEDAGEELRQVLENGKPEEVRAKYRLR